MFESIFEFLFIIHRKYNDKIDERMPLVKLLFRYIIKIFHIRLCYLVA